MVTSSHYTLGTVDASEAVIRDLYLRLRSELFKWASVTFQTPQPRMGYVGQHLVSVVTGFPGGRSGARGKDLVLPHGHAEIKTCYRVDQLGSCVSCGAVVASVELSCQACGSEAITRKDDSKWLISPKHDKDMREIFEPVSYYLVLFDFHELAHPEIINARIYDVDPKRVGFAYCIIDYYVNIRANSTSGAPFNLWPFSLKFQLMEPTLIYHAQIDSSDTITTLKFPGKIGHPVPISLDPLTTFSGSRGFTLRMVNDIAQHFGHPLPMATSKSEGLTLIEGFRRQDSWENAELVHAVCNSMYGARIVNHEDWLPVGLR